MNPTTSVDTIEPDNSIAVVGTRSGRREGVSRTSDTRMRARRWIWPIALTLISGCAGEVEQPTSETSTEATVEAPASSSPAVDIAELRDQGWKALNAGDVETADELARSAIEAKPQDRETIFLMAFVLVEQNRFAEAIRSLEKLAEREPATRLVVMKQIAEWMVLQGRWLDAEAVCYEVLEQDPGAVALHRLLVQLFTRQGRRLDAANHLRFLCRQGDIEQPELLALIKTFYSFSYGADEEEYEPISALGVAHYQISGGEWDAAVQTLAELSDRNPAESALFGRLLVKQGDSQKLNQWASEVPESARLTSDYWFAAGVHQAQLGNHVEAIKNLCVCLVRDQTDREAYAFLSESLKELGATPKAEQAADRAALIDRTQRIADELESATSIDVAKVGELMGLLEQLQRPFEALGWREIMLITAQPNANPTDVQRARAEIDQRRRQLLQSNQMFPSRTFLLCGVSPAIWQSQSGDDKGEK